MQAVQLESLEVSPTALAQETRQTVNTHRCYLFTDSKKCLPVLYYVIEVCPLNKAHINSLDFAVGSCFSKIFCTKSRETISECMQLFNCQSIKDVADKRRQNFVKKYSVSRNGLYKLFT